MEVSYSKDRPINKNNIASQAREDLKRVGLLSPYDNISIEDINDIKYGYPIYDKDYSKARQEILKYLSGNNIISIGRYGSWRYMSMEDTILDGKRAANII